MSLHLVTLGQLKVIRDGREIPLPVQRRVRVALLVYLAIEREVTREKLASVFWPDSEEEKARHALSQALYQLRQLIGEDWLIVAGDRIRVSSSVQVDADMFARAVQNEEYDVALKLYSGAFLSGVDNLPSTANFENWADAQRAHLERLHRQARRETIRAQSAASDHQAAIATARAWVGVTPAEDEAHHKLIELLAQSGQATEAIRHFQSYERQLAKEDLRPLDETTALIASLERNDLSRTATARASSVSAPTAEGPFPWLHTIGAELRRRHVLRVLTAYAVVSWGVIEVTATTFPLAGLPDWTPRIVLWTVAALLPVVAILAWVYDITPRGVVRTNAVGVRVRSFATRRGAFSLMLGGVVLWGGFEARQARLHRVGGLDEKLVLILPFRVLPDTTVAPLGEGMVDLLTMRITEAGVTKAVDPATALAISAKQATDLLTPHQRFALARSVKARYVLTGSAVETLDELTLSATLEDAAYGRPRSASVRGPASKPMKLVDDLAAKILGISINERSDRLEALTTTSTPALYAYLQGIHAWRVSGARASAPFFEAALKHDSTFALAALRLTHVGRYNDVGGMAEADRALDLAWKARDRLSANDKLWLSTITGPNYPRWFWWQDRTNALRAALLKVPESIELWEDLGDALYHAGRQMGMRDPFSEAKSALTRAFAYDSTLTEPRYHLFQIAALERDTASLKRFARIWHRTQPEHAAIAYVNWQVAASTGDSKALESIRRSIGRMNASALQAIADAAQVQGVRIEDAELATRVMKERNDQGWEIYDFDLALNGGRHRDALANIDAAMERGRPARNFRHLLVTVNLLNNVDVPGLESLVKSWEQELPDTIPSHEPRRGLYLGSRCLIARWYLARGETDAAERTLELIRQIPLDAVADPQTETTLVLCPAILEAELDLQRPNRPRASVEHLDSLSRRGLPASVYLPTIGLITSRLWERQGDYRRALAAAQRRWTDMTRFLAPHIYQEARMAAAVGDNKTAIRAYRHYLALRPNPDDKAENDRIRAEVARLERLVAKRN